VVTRTGIVAGTPAYMSPEQFRGEAPDPRSDQFSFCVSLYEAIYRQRPFAGRTLDEVADAIVHGRLAAPPAGVSVPAALHAAVMRGLRDRREDRHPNMEALLGELAVSAAATSAPRRKRSAVIAAAGGLALSGLALTAVLTAGSAEDAPAPAPAPARVTAAADRAAPAPEAMAPVAADASPPIAMETPADPAPVDQPAPAAGTRKASARLKVTRSHPPRRRDDDAPAARETPPPPVRVGDGLRDPFGGGGGH
jgi:serine/threonine protein kinase